MILSFPLGIIFFFWKRVIIYSKKRRKRLKASKKFTGRSNGEGYRTKSRFRNKS